MTLKRRNLEIENRDYAYIGIDFDNTVVSDLFPEVGLSLGAEPILKKLIANGHKLILWTVRSGEALDKAVDWFKQMILNCLVSMRILNLKVMNKQEKSIVTCILMTVHLEFNMMLSLMLLGTES